MQAKTETALVIFSGGQDSTTCLLQAISERGADKVEAVTFSYGQRHAIELEKAAWIARDLGIRHSMTEIPLLAAWGGNALTAHEMPIEHTADCIPNTCVDGRNALFLLYAAIYAKSRAIRHIITGVCETDFSGYPDCRDVFVKSMNVTLNLAMDFTFFIHTPLMHLNKAQVWALADQLGRLDYVREHSHTCYEGIENGCGKCPACLLRERGLRAYLNHRGQTL